MAGHIHKGLDIGVFGLMANSDTTHCSSRRDTCSAMFTESEHIFSNDIAKVSCLFNGMYMLYVNFFFSKDK